MTHHERNVAGSQARAKGGLSKGEERVNQPGLPSYTRLPRPFSFWISHRQGPFMIHRTEDCDTGPKVMGCYNTHDNLIEQGFMPCPKCDKE